MTRSGWIEHRDLLIFAERHRVTICVNQACQSLPVIEAQTIHQGLATTIRAAWDWDADDQPHPTPPEDE